MVAAHILASIAKVDVEEYGLSMFSRVGGLKDKDPRAEISADFKEYSENGVNIGIGQCEVTTLNDLRDYSDSYLEALNEVRSMKGLDWAVLMITDVIHAHSALLCTDHRGNRHLPYSLIAKNIFDMPHVMSRKKQLLPEIIHAVGDQ